MGPAVLITIGVLFLLDQMGHMHWMDFGFTWPALLIVIGLIKLLEHSASINGHVPREYGANCRQMPVSRCLRERPMYPPQGPITPQPPSLPRDSSLPGSRRRQSRRTQWLASINILLRRRHRL